MSDASDDKVVVPFTLHREQFTKDPQYAPLFYDALGRVVVVWGRYEHLLTAHLRVALNVAGFFGIKGEIRNSLKAKVDLIQDLYTKLAILAEQAPELIRITDEAKNLGEDRNLLIHSQVDGFQDGDPPRIKMVHHGHSKGQMKITELAPDIATIGSVAGHAHRLLNEQMPYFLLLLEDHKKVVKNFELEPKLNR